MPDLVTAAVLREPKRSLELAELTLDDPEPSEVRVRTLAVGLCHSDVHYVAGTLAISLPAVLGHEVCGVVEEVGSAVTRLSPGDRVVATVTPSCGGCRSCLSGRPTQCSRTNQMRRRPRPRLATPSGAEVTALGGIGAFASAFLAPEPALARVEPTVPSQVACLLGCCVSTGIGAVIHAAAVTPDDTVAVIGCGGVGMAAIQGARLAGARRIVAVDTQPEKLTLASSFGATDIVAASDDVEVTVAAVQAAVPGGVDYSFEAVGHPATAELAYRILAPSGTATVLGLMGSGEQIRISADALVYGDRSLRGAYMGANRFLSDVDTFTDHYLAGRLDLDAMVTQVLPFDAINEGLRAMSNPDTIRIVLEVADDPAADRTRREGDQTC